MRHGLTKFGIKITHVDLTDPENLRTVISDKTRVVYFETPANPNMRLVDISHVSEIAHEAGATVIVDNTYATPYLTRRSNLAPTSFCIRPPSIWVVMVTSWPVWLPDGPTRSRRSVSSE